MLQVLLIAVFLMALVLLGLGLNIFFRKGGKFPETEIGKNRKMHELGIVCVKCEEFKRYREARKIRSLKNINSSVLKLDIEGIGC